MQSIVSTSFASGSGTNAGTALAFLSPTVEVTTMLGQRVLVTATQTIGHSNAFGATGLDVFVCYMRAQLGLVLNTVGIGLTGLAVAPYTRMPVTLSADFAPGAGTFKVGLCGKAPNRSGWNSAAGGYVTAVVHN